MSEEVLGANSHAALHAGQKLGLGGGLVADLLKQFGPTAVQILLQVLQKYIPAGASAPAHLGLSVPVIGDVSIFTKLLSSLVSQHRDDLVNWLSEQERTLLDQVIAKLSAL